MQRPTCSLEHLIDQIDITESEREAVKAQVRLAESTVDALAAVASGISKLLKPLIHWKAGKANLANR
ncbi:hypothetical protein IMCC3135_28165 [Granulosicoccus antarcticus IMCC3135]|uniref:Uncharacterized protein n=1 Tax=Granulosicoccus antarcticus IMCC3135 TaxID=1192854 RepID=A0A2Z2NZ29_9GAMM|nr:hypothetical protein IMCC3135_28165 [Granulosicoccus antarcticus IMCC3135]